MSFNWPIAGETHRVKFRVENEIRLGQKCIKRERQRERENCTGLKPNEQMTKATHRQVRRLVLTTEEPKQR